MWALQIDFIFQNQNNFIQIHSREFNVEKEVIMGRKRSAYSVFEDHVMDKVCGVNSTPDAARAIILRTLEELKKKGLHLAFGGFRHNKGSEYKDVEIWL
jgi:hypothetical protein